MLAWYEAEGKKRPRSPNADNSANEDSAQNVKSQAGKMDKCMCIQGNTRRI